MKLLAIKRRLSSLLRPSSASIILLISRPVTWRALEIFSMIFDQVLIENLEGLIHLDQPPRSPPPNVLYSAQVIPSSPRVEQEARAGSAVWVQGRYCDVLTFQSPRVDRSTSTSTITRLLGRDAEKLRSLSSDRGLLDSHTPEFYPSRCGMVLVGRLEQMSVRGAGPTFVILQEDDDLLTVIAAAAREDIRNRLFSGLTGLES